MVRPMIGITPGENKEKDALVARKGYMEAIVACGGLPLLLPLEAGEDESLWADIAGQLDGFLFSGGGDVDPRLYGEHTMTYCGQIDPKRDVMELALMAHVAAAKKPVLAVCRGVQVMNVALGGTLYQDIPAQHQGEMPLAHWQKMPYNYPAHEASVQEGTLLRRLMEKDTIEVNSMHHQGIKDVAPGLVASAFAPCGLAEALEMPGHPFFLGLQWHPEHMWRKDAGQRRIFEAFIAAARG